MTKIITVNEEAYLSTPAYEVQVEISSSVEEAAVRCALAYMKAFNAQDSGGTNAVINFPHVRLAGTGHPRIAATPDELMRPEVFAWLREHEEWHHSKWDHIRVVHASEVKVHLDVQFTRYREDGSVIGHYPSLWVMTCQDGHWGIQIRSSYAK